MSGELSFASPLALGTGRGSLQRPEVLIECCECCLYWRKGLGERALIARRIVSLLPSRTVWRRPSRCMMRLFSQDVDDDLFYPFPLIRHFSSTILSLYTSLHKAGIVHRDVETRHWLRHRDGSMRIIDFDMAVVHHLDSKDNSRSARRKRAERKSEMESEMRRVRYLLE